LTVAAALAAFIAWLGVSLIVLADGRRGVAVGLALMSIGLAALAGIYVAPLDAVPIAAGGLVAGFVRDRSGPAGWGIMPPGSTPRLILCVAAALLGLWIALSITTGTAAPLRFAVLAVIVQAGSRLLSTREPALILAAVAALALAIGVSSAVATGAPGAAPFAAAGLVAAGAMFVRQPASHAA